MVALVLGLIVHLGTLSRYYFAHSIIPCYNILKSGCRCSQTADRNSCSIVSGDISNCSYQLSVLPLTSLHLSLA